MYNSSRALSFFRRRRGRTMVEEVEHLWVAAIQKCALNLSIEQRRELGKIENKLWHLYRHHPCRATPEFIAYRMEILIIELKYRSQLRHLFAIALGNGEIPKKVYNDAIRALDNHGQAIELCILKRRGNVFVRDFQAVAHLYTSIENAYSFMLTRELYSDISEQHKVRKSDWRTFEKSLGIWYCSKRPILASGYYEGYCHVTGVWLGMDKIKATHIIPKSLQGGEIDYLFGYRDTNLSDPANGLVLLDWIKRALDENEIVIVPDPSETELNWKVLVTDRANIEMMSPAGDQWRGINGTKLKFLGENRPAARFLCLRFIVSYVKCREMGRTKWMNGFELDAWGYMWADSGPYLRRSMLEALVRRTADCCFTLPPAVLNHVSFNDCFNRSAEEDGILALSLIVRWSAEVSYCRSKKNIDDSDSEPDVSSESEPEDELINNGDEVF